MANTQLDALTTEESLKMTIREGRELLKDFKQAIKEAEHLTTKLVEEEIRANVKPEIEELMGTLRTNMTALLKASEARIFKRFAQIESALFGDGQIPVPIDELAKQKAEEVGHPVGPPGKVRT